MEKHLEMSSPTSCLSKAADDEPIFVLRAQDKFAPLLVEMWANLAQMFSAAPSKVAEARACAERMRKWPKRRLPT